MTISGVTSKKSASGAGRKTRARAPIDRHQVAVAKAALRDEIAELAGPSTRLRGFHRKCKPRQS